ncbi:response regulator [Rubritalea tangerina]|uniref:response regulator n=1 Tax=Rubritalea tangerina TaxID=430798 RepID=UPI0036224533
MHEASKTCILIVDDRVENIDILTALLGDSFKIKVATNGNKAIQLASSPQPDLILLDVEMPEMDGYQVCESLKSNPQTSDISVIFLTARAEKNDQKHGFMIGATIISRNPSTQISHAHASNPDSSSSLIKNNSPQRSKTQKPKPTL